MDKVVHFEIPVDNISRAQKFYSVFGWQMQEMPGMDYISVRTTPDGAQNQPSPSGFGAINGGMMKRSKEVKGPVIAVEVNSIDKYLERVVKAGGKIIAPKMQIAEYGYYAYVADTEGNVLGLWESIQKS
jgi:predicted enzyme related to lactoylglutathione lyase